MRKVERTHPLWLAAAAAMGAAIGLVMQFAFTGRGQAPFVPPLSMPITLAMLSVVLLFFGLRLRRTVMKKPGAVNPFHAVRLLAAARAGQVVGSLFGGFGGGLLLSLTGRVAPTPLTMWLPMALTLLTGAALVICGAVAEYLCRVPPGDENDKEEADPLHGHAEGTAYRE